VLKNNSILNLIGGVSRIAVSLIIFPMLIRYFGTHQYGVYSFIFSIVNLSSIIENGLTSTSASFLNSNSEGGKSSLGNSLSTVIIVTVSAALICGLTLFLSNIWLSTFMNGLSTENIIEISFALKISAITVILRVIQSIFSGYFISISDFKTISFYNISNSVVLLLAGLFTIFFKVGVAQYFTWYLLLSASIFLGYSIIGYRSLLRTSFSFDFSGIKNYLKQVGYNWGTLFSTSLFSVGDKLIVAKILGPSSLSIYHVITTIGGQINQVSALLTQPVISIASKPIVSREEMLKYWNINIYSVYILVLTLVLYAEIVLKYFLGDTVNREVYICYYIILIVYGVYSTNSFGYYSLIGIKKGNVNLRLIFPFAVLCLFIL
jgi:O-antigen/teichoic acid export membrane protein